MNIFKSQCLYCHLQYEEGKPMRTNNKIEIICEHACSGARANCSGVW